MSLKTVLYDAHLAGHARMVDFGGWLMPLHYGSQIEEHHAVRRAAGMFDVSHMGIIDITGGRAREFLRTLLANDVAHLATVGQALYSCMLRPDGGVIDDLIVYHMSEIWYRLVVNAGTRAKDMAWIREQSSGFDVQVSERQDLAMIAVQGPEARRHGAQLLAPAQQAAAMGIPNFSGAAFGSWFVARTGYTGEDGFEIMLPAADAPDAWARLREGGVAPAGLGARDTLRLEAGMSLYGNELDEEHHPLQSGIAWSVAFEPEERRFIGRAALEAVRRVGEGTLVGLLLEGRGVLRSHQNVLSVDEPGAVLGHTTSGTFSPTLGRSIGLARLDIKRSGIVHVHIRGSAHRARIVKPPFVRHGQVLINLHPETAE